MISENFKEKQMVNLLTNQHPLSKRGNTFLSVFVPSATGKFQKKAEFIDRIVIMIIKSELVGIQLVL